MALSQLICALSGIRRDSGQVMTIGNIASILSSRQAWKNDSYLEMSRYMDYPRSMGNMSRGNDKYYDVYIS